MGRLVEVNAATLLSLQLHDGNTTRGVRARVYNSAGTEQVGSPFALSHTALGFYRSVGWTPTVEGPYHIRYAVYTDGTYATLAPQYSQVGEIVEVRSVDQDLATLLSRLTAGRATNLDNLDATISSRQSETDALSRYNNLVSEHDATQAAIAALNDLSIADVQTALTNQGYTVVRAGKLDNLDNLDAAISSRQSEADALSRYNALVAEHDATQAAVAALNDLSIADVQTALTNQGYTTIRAGLLDNLNATVSSRATQVSVDALPTAAQNADAVWDEARAGHTAIGSFGEANQGIVSTARANNLDNLDVTISSREAESDASTRHGENQSDLNTLLSRLTSIRASNLDFLDALISSRASQASVDALNDLSIADVQTALTNQGYTVARAPNLDNLDTTVSSRASQASLDALNNLSIANVQTALTNQGYTVTRASNLDFLDVSVSSRSDHTSAEVANAVWNDARVSHTAAGSFGEALQGVLSVSRAANLDNLDATISSRATASALASLDAKVGSPAGASVSADIASVKSDTDSLNATKLTTARANNLDNLDATISSRATQSSVSAIQNNTRFVGIVPETLVRPDTGTTNYKFFARLFDTSGNPEDPDTNTINITIKTVAGVTLTGPTAMTRIDVGQYEYTYGVADTDTPQALNVFFDYDEAAVPFNQVRVTEVVTVDAQTGIDTLLSRLTAGRASNLDNLDATISSRATQTSVSDIDTKIGVPLVTVSDDIASVQSDTTTLVSRLTSARAGNLDNLDATITSRESEADALARATAAAKEATLALVKAKTDQLNFTGSNVDAQVKVNEDKIDYALSAAAVSGLADSIWDELRAGHTVLGSFGEALQGVLSTARAANLDNLDATVSTRSTQTSVNTVIGYVDELETRLTAGRALNLDNLDATVSSRATQVSVDALPTAANNADAVWDEARSGHVSVGSFGEALQGILSVARASNLDNLDVAVSTRGDKVTLDLVHGHVDDLETRLTVARADNLDNLDATISSRATQVSVDAIPTAAQNADAVWDELRAGHVGAGSFGQALQGVLSTTRAANLDKLDVNVSTRATQVSVDALPTNASIADAVWDEILSGHSTLGSAGLALTSAAAGGLNPTAIQLIADEVWERELADHTNIGTYGYHVGNLENEPLSNIASAVWDRLRADSSAPDTFGEALQGVLTVTRAGYLDNLADINVLLSSRASQATVDANLVLLTTLESRLTAGRASNLDNLDVAVSTRAAASSITGLPNAAQIADAVWDELLSGHNGAGSAGLALSDAGAVTSPSAIADAVWDELKSGHNIAGSFGAYLDAAISSRSSAAQINDIAGVGFNNSTDSLEAIRDKINTLPTTAGDATLTKQNDILAQLATKASLSLLTTVDGKVSAIPTNPLLDNDARLNNLDAAISSRLSTADFNTIKGAGFNPTTDSLEAIRDAVAATIDLTPVLTSLSEIKGIGFLTAQHSLVTINTNVLATKVSADGAKAAAENAEAAVASKASQASVDSLATDVGNIPTNPLLDNDARVDRLDVEVSSRASQASLAEAKGPTFNPATDSLEKLYDSINAINPGDATLVKQNEILSQLAGKALETTAQAVLSTVSAIPANPLLDNDTRLNRLDVPVSTRATDNDMQQIKGAGFSSGTHSLVEIFNAISAASLDLTPVLSELSVIKGSGFTPALDDLHAANEKAIIERAQIKSDTASLLSSGEGF